MEQKTNETIQKAEILRDRWDLNTREALNFILEWIIKVEKWKLKQ